MQFYKFLFNSIMPHLGIETGCVENLYRTFVDATDSNFE